MKSLLLATALSTTATFAFAAAEKFTVDPSHAQIVFSYDHVGYSTNWGMLSGFEGEIMFDQENPENSSVSALSSGDLTRTDTTKDVVLDATMNKVAPFPFGPNAGKPAAGFSATTTVLRSDFGVGAFAPAVSDEVQVQLSLEAVKLD